MFGNPENTLFGRKKTRGKQENYAEETNKSSRLIGEIYITKKEGAISRASSNFYNSMYVPSAAINSSLDHILSNQIQLRNYHRY